jgi:hypothetical protein
MGYAIGGLVVWLFTLWAVGAAVTNPPPTYYTFKGYIDSGMVYNPNTNSPPLGTTGVCEDAINPAYTTDGKWHCGNYEEYPNLSDAKCTGYLDASQMTHLINNNPACVSQTEPLLNGPGG